MGAHNARRTRRSTTTTIAGRGALTAATAFALLGGGAGVAFAGDAPTDAKAESSHDKGGDDWGHDKGDHKGKDHDGWGKKHDKCEHHKKWDGDEKWEKKESAGFLGGIIGEMPKPEPEHKKDDCDDHHGKKWDGHKKDKDEMKSPSEVTPPSKVTPPSESTPMN